MVGTLMAVTGGLCIGKEGPLAHIGANVGAIVCQAPIKGFRVLQNDVTKRQLIAAGASAGVSAAFGAPIGGSLFSYEISKPNTFWTFSMLWRVFLCSSISTFTLSILSALASDSPFSLSDQATLKFGDLEDEENSLLDLPAAIIVGATCGCLGALFIHVNVSLAILRKKYITKNWMKIWEALFFAFATSFVFFGTTLLRGKNCTKSQPGNEDDEFRFYCPDGEYNPLASLIFNTEGGTIRSFLAYPLSIKDLEPDERPVSTWNILIYLVLWYFFTITTYGVWVPAGLFLPGILIGCSVGLLYMQLMIQGFGYNIERIGGQSYIIIGAASMLAGYCRLTYSLAVIMLETTQSINLFLPMLIGIMVSLAVARGFNRSLYDYAIRAKQMPLLRNHVPKKNKDMRVKELLAARDYYYSCEVVESVCQVQRLEQLIQTPYHTIPVVNMAGKLIGLIPKSFIFVLIENHQWYNENLKSKK